MRLEPKNYDVGVVTPAGTYLLDDETQAYWLRLLASNHFSTMTPSIRAELPGYYKNLDAPIATKRDTNKWGQLVMQLQELKAIAPMQTATYEHGLQLCCPAVQYRQSETMLPLVP